ncbi:hypothetical protein HK096_001780 [Nowakowskiella sp. JEL0078]|nr:hypothetical protein HK096_001780 [Nowakowskiella sp. JEL0078]
MDGKLSKKSGSFINQSNSQLNSNKTPALKAVPHTRHYVESYGYNFIEHHVATPDGFILTLERVQTKNHKVSKGPVILMHGLFQSSGVFVTSGANSLAFFLAEQGYDVWLANNRCVFTSYPHLVFSANDSELWEWSLDDLARFDFPTIVQFVFENGVPKGTVAAYFDSMSKEYRTTEFSVEDRRIVFIGHSQGNAQAFHGLNFDPSIGDKIKCLVALAPAVYLGNLLSDIWKHKNSYFQFTPRPTSSRAIFHWAQSARAGVIVPFFDQSFKAGDLDLLRSSDSIFDAKKINCPFMLFSGGKDAIVNGDKLAKTCYDTLSDAKNGGRVRMVHTRRIEKYEHLDFLWARDAQQLVFEEIRDELEKL